ncbi:hypothetical protein DPMN_091337 [Dreissena polymorpha]|uniref:Uncharacterized protein n=1 Tax=Dreissena polymorpha TaxID=45954 RepID=A0A9D4L1F3_DREPO|nr:hypothetical protein DPMN_091337 [Dreissena polymorpha]
MAATTTDSPYGGHACFTNSPCIDFVFQFIVVSLKDGMFNNANVLFKTKFVDGVSTVTKYVQHANRSEDSKENGGQAANKKKQAANNKRLRIESNA